MPVDRPTHAPCNSTSSNTAATSCCATMCCMPCKQRDAVAARAAWQQLRAELPRDETLADLDSAGDRAGSTAEHGRSPSTPRHRRRYANCATTSNPAAHRLLGDAAGTAWLPPLWRRLARARARLPFAPKTARACRARCGFWPATGRAAAQAVARIESWRRIPAPLAWMAEAQLPAARPGRSPGACWPNSPGCHRDVSTALTQRLADPLLQRLRRAVRRRASRATAISRPGLVAGLVPDRKARRWHRCWARRSRR